MIADLSTHDGGSGNSSPNIPGSSVPNAIEVDHIVKKYSRSTAISPRWTMFRSA
jgi:hypothetical protein